jgi:glyoxylase-like metal-dependent hydrolase (beta-lactamase superfamily II)
MNQKGAVGAGWRSLGGLGFAPRPFFDKILFLEGYEFSSNIYALAGDYLTLIDPGNDYTAFIQLFELFKPADVKKIVLTHGHVDHAMGVVELLQAYPSSRQGGGFEVILHEAGPAELKHLVRQFGCRVTEVKGGEVLQLGGCECEVIPTPGHTADGICLYHPPTGTVFTGDVVLPHAMAAPDPVSGGQIHEYLAGLKSLLKRPIKHVLPGHGPPVFEEGRRVVLDTYEGVVRHIVGAKTPWDRAALMFLRIGYLEETIFCCDKWLESGPEDLTALELKGMCLNDLGRHEEAGQIFDRILAREGQRVPALVGKGYALMGQDRYAESLSYFDAALQLEPRLREAHVYKGLALYLSGRADEAMDVEVFREEFAQRIKAGLLQRNGAGREG